MEGFDEVIEEFLVESYESLDQLDRDLLALEDTPEDRDRLASIFRTCLLYTSPSPRDLSTSRMPSSA